MKKKFLTIVGVTAFAVTVGLNINAGLNNDTASDMALANVEALAQSETGMEQWATALDTKTFKPKCCAEITSGSCSLSTKCD